MDRLKSLIAQHLPGWKARLPATLMNPAYAGMAAGALWPLVAAMQAGQVDVAIEFGGLLANLGANLLSEQITRWRDEADAMAQLDAALPKDDALRAQLDAVLEKLEAPRLAREALSEADQQWFVETLRAELARLGNLPRYEQHGWLNIAASRDVIVHGHVVAGNLTIINPPLARPNLRAAYLRSLLEGECRRLPLQALDPRLRTNVGVALELNELYVPLVTLTPEEHELWARGERDMEAQHDRERRLSALDQLNRHRRLLLLGDPGFGKSTFVNFVTLCLAGAALNDPRLNLQTLTAPVPQEEKENERPQNWEHGPLLPVRVVLREFAEHLPQAGGDASTLWTFIEQQLRANALDEYAGDLKAELQTKGGLILLDGLDEVPQANDRRAQLIAIIEAFAVAFAQCRVLVTGRVYAYRRQDWRLADFAVTTLAPFTLPQMQAFAGLWYARLDSRHKLPATPDAMAEELLRNIRDRKQLRDLARQPLLLTFMAGLRIFSPLPDRRQELYEKIVELLFNEWEQGKLTARPGQAPPSLAQLLRLSPDELRGALEKLAFDAHSLQPADAGARTADITEEQLVNALYQLIKDRPNPPGIDDLKAHLKDRAGLLIEHGAERYTFPHRTFQEYLAACHLTRTGTQKQAADMLRGDPDRWREVALLAAARWHSGGRDSLWSLARKLCPVELALNPPLPEAWAAQVAGQALAEAGERPTDADERQTAHTLNKSLLKVLAAPAFPAVERARAGRTLAQLGDPRPEVLTVEAMQFAFIPAGRFWMGGEGEYDGKPQHQCDVLTYDYWLARYPVTNAQFEQFTKAEGYSNGDYWPEARAAGFWKNGAFKGLWDNQPRQGPAPSGNPFDLPNHPVVNVSWYEALAFTRWLTELAHQKQWLPADWSVRLPSEAEWEKAARGGERVPPPGQFQFQSLVETRRGASLLRADTSSWIANPNPKRAYPWGDDPDPNRANYDDTQIGATSAVGAFLAGASPYGVEEMSGNVWEWTRSHYKDYPYKNAKEREDLKAGDNVSRVLRGGAFYYRAGFARCAFRLRHYPYRWPRYDGFRVGVSPFL